MKNKNLIFTILLMLSGSFIHSDQEADQNPNTEEVYNAPRKNRSQEQKKAAASLSSVEKKKLFLRAMNNMGRTEYRFLQSFAFGTVLFLGAFKASRQYLHPFLCIPLSAILTSTITNELIIKPHWHELCEEYEKNIITYTQSRDPSLLQISIPSNFENVGFTEMTEKLHNRSRYIPIAGMAAGASGTLAIIGIIALT